MYKKILIISLVALGLTLNIGCTSSGNEDKPADVAEASEAPEGEEALAEDGSLSGEGLEGDDLAGLDEEGGGDLAGTDDLGAEGGDDFGAEGGDDFAGGDLAAEDPGDSLAEDSGEMGGGDLAGTDDLGGGVEDFSETPAPESNFAEDPLLSSGETPLEDPYALNDMGSDPAVDVPAEEEPTKTYVSVKKIASSPWDGKNGVVNAVYIARKGDTISSVAQKIFGSDKKSELLSVNPHLARGLKVGDKVYYSSPQRPTDRAQILTFYEDMGLSPEEYITQPGDNIRVVAKKLLGHDRSWMELWATNAEVESKGDVPEGLRLRYWASSEISAAPATGLAKNNSLPEMPDSQDSSMDEEDSSSDMASNDLPPPPDMPEMPSNDLPPPPPDMGGPGDMANNDMPPPPAMATIDAPPPPPPPAPKKFSKPSTGAAVGGMDNDQTMLLAAGAILLLAGAILFIMIKKRRARKEMDFHTATHTQIE